MSVSTEKKGIPVIQDPEQMSEFVSERKREGKTIGFVPTMGYLHQGHQSLFRQAVGQTDCAVASVFVNPTQFGDHDDFINYPKDLEHDLKLAEETGIAALFCPNEAAIYPNGTAVTVKVADKKINVLCGKSRPGHFDGVATVLTKLFTIVQPDIVFFGMKDAQQVAVIDDLIRAFHFPIKLVACPIVREADGLAISSRNVRLTAEERQEAVHLSRGLQAGQKAIRNGNLKPAAIIQIVKDYLVGHLTSGKVDYVDVLEYPSLVSPESGVLRGRYIIAVAVYFSKARLIDNVTGDTEEGALQ